MDVQLYLATKVSKMLYILLCNRTFILLCANAIQNVRISKSVQISELRD